MFTQKTERMHFYWSYYCLLLIFPPALLRIVEWPRWIKMNKNEIFMPAGLLTGARGILLAFPIFQGFHALFYQGEQRSFPTGLLETGWKLQSLGQNASSFAIEWSTAGAGWGYRPLLSIKNRKSKIHGQRSVQSHSVNWPQLCWSTFLQNQPGKNCFWALCDRRGSPICLC